MRIKINLITLVLTPHRQLLPNTGSILFTGGWCLNRPIRAAIEEAGLTYKTAGYPWDDREKYYQDYLYLIPIYESFLSATTLALNEIHATRFDREYWRILAGPAIYTLLCHLLDRWRVVTDILEKDAFDAVRCFSFAPYSFTPNVLTDIDPDSHDYNHYLLQSALREQGIDFTKLVLIEKSEGNQPVDKANPPKPRTGFLKRNLRSLLEMAARHSGAGLNNKYAIFKSYLPRPYELFLNLALGNMPIQQCTKQLPKSGISPETRTGLRLEVDAPDRFCRFASKMLPELMPAYLIEGFRALDTYWKNCNWPTNPKCIFTSNAFQFNEIFQHYTATKRADLNSRLVIGQHGGVSGILKWSFGEYHEVTIADKYISWGWSSPQEKVIPGFVLTNLGKKLSSRKDGCLLLTTVPMRRYSHKGGAWPVGPQQSAAFLADQMRFYGNLKSPISSDAVLRIFEAQDVRFESEYIDTWRSNYPEIKIDPSKEPIGKALKRTKLFVYTYCSTGYLESLAINFPTLIFWDPCLFETSPNFTAGLNELEKVGIYHRTPESAALHVNDVWHDLENWWHAPHVQRCRVNFVNAFARQPPSHWINFFKTQLSS